MSAVVGAPWTRRTAALLAGCWLALAACTITPETDAAAGRAERLERARDYAVRRSRLRASPDDRAFVEDLCCALEVIDRDGLDALPEGTDERLPILAKGRTLGPSNELLADPGFARRLAERLRSEDIGTQEPSIVGGQRTTGHPDCVAVGKGGEWCCSGTLIARDVVLTAGHCNHHCGAPPDRVFFGSDVKAGGIEVPIVARYRRKDYRFNRGRSRNDLMLLFLEKGVRVKPSPIAAAALADQPELKHRIVGFGYSDTGATTGKGQKREAFVTVVTVDCAGPGEADMWNCDPGLQLVASDPGLTPTDACVGDSGGPMYVRRPGGPWYLCGVTSHSVGEPTRTRYCGDGAAYVRVDRYLPHEPQKLRAKLDDIRAGQDADWERPNDRRGLTAAPRRGDARN